jgi:hypothetical protein
MAKRTRTMAPESYREPSPQQQFEYALDHAVEKAVLAHPQTQKLRKQLTREMKSAAKKRSAQSTARRRTTKRKRA